MRSRAVALLNWLKTRPDVISSDDTGKVSLHGESIPHSDITDLISDTVRGRKNFNPAGSTQFFSSSNQNEYAKMKSSAKRSFRKMILLQRMGDLNSIYLGTEIVNPWP